MAFRPRTIKIKESEIAGLEEQLKKYPNAAQWDWESAQLEVARSLAGNTRAIVQVGKGSEIAQAFLLSDALHSDWKQEDSSSYEKSGKSPDKNPKVSAKIQSQD